MDYGGLAVPVARHHHHCRLHDGGSRPCFQSSRSERPRGTGRGCQEGGAEIRDGDAGGGGGCHAVGGSQLGEEAAGIETEVAEAGARVGCQGVAEAHRRS